MINEKKTKLILKKCKAGEEYQESNIYLSIFIFTGFIVLLAFFPNFQKSSIELVTRITITFVAAFFILSIAYLIIDEIKKAYSYNALNLALNSIRKGDWNWVNVGIFKRPAEIHPIVMGHPTVMFLFGQFFLREGKTEEGKLLIYRATSKDPKLDKIKKNSKIDETGFQYLHDTLKSGKAFERTNFFRKMYGIKLVRYTFFILFTIFILLHILVQIAKET